MCWPYFLEPDLLPPRRQAGTWGGGAEGSGAAAAPSQGHRACVPGERPLAAPPHPQDQAHRPAPAPVSGPEPDDASPPPTPDSPPPHAIMPDGERRPLDGAWRRPPRRSWGRPTAPPGWRGHDDRTGTLAQERGGGGAPTASTPPAFPTPTARSRGARPAGTRPPGRRPTAAPTGRQRPSLLLRPSLPPWLPTARPATGGTRRPTSSCLDRAPPGPGRLGRLSCISVSFLAEPTHSGRSTGGLRIGSNPV